jgi:hypothetical protein
LNVPLIFAEADVIAECFDRAQEKQMIVETVLTKMDKAIVVTVSGLAGYGNSNAIQTRRIASQSGSYSSAMVAAALTASRCLWLHEWV